ncbi:polysaccharide deacetylase family protein [Brevibacillus laterosporus]|nr:polysaccharide deacetylase [Brevibacillus laterosporus]TPH16764.1 polysaccharide deacetylase family protein [Brevibacillus laterosporus]HAS01000.1 polysaccharide deacetylase [Brevibacillus sp.]
MGEVLMKKTILFLQVIALIIMLPASVGAVYSMKGIPVLIYHSIADKPDNPYCVPPREFEEQMKWLHDEGYQTLTATELLQYYNEGKQVPDKSVVITIDDGYDDNYLIAYPIFQAYKQKATIFVTAGSVGRPSFMTWDHIKEMHNSGLIDFQSHTMTHAHLDKLSPDVVYQELALSKAMLEAKLHKNIDILAYPYGGFNRAMLPTVREVGYKMAFTTVPSKTTPKQGMHTLRRMEIHPKASLQALLQPKPMPTTHLTFLSSLSR